MLFLGTFPMELLLKLCWEWLAPFSFGIWVRSCLSASTEDVQIFNDVIVLFSLPECFTRGYWKLWCLLFVLFITCYMVGGVGMLSKSRDISVTEVSLLVWFFFQLILRLGLFIMNSRNNVCLFNVHFLLYTNLSQLFISAVLTYSIFLIFPKVCRKK